MSIEKKMVSPKQLYPLTKIEYVNPEKLNLTIDEAKKDKLVTPIEVIEYGKYYFIYEGNCEMLAANIIKKPYVEIEILDRHKLGFWKNDNDLECQLSLVGMNTLHDFEEIGEFKYLEYPKWYYPKKEN